MYRCIDIEISDISNCEDAAWKKTFLSKDTHDGCFSRLFPTEMAFLWGCLFQWNNSHLLTSSQPTYFISFFLDFLGGDFSRPVKAKVEIRKLWKCNYTTLNVLSRDNSGEWFGWNRGWLAALSLSPRCWHSRQSHEPHLLMFKCLSCFASVPYFTVTISNMEVEMKAGRFSLTNPLQQARLGPG